MSYGPVWAILTCVEIIFIGLLGIGPRLQDPQPCVLPLYDSPFKETFFVGPPGLVTHNFLLEICATPPRPVGLRLSIPNGQNISLRELFSVGPPGIEPGLHAPEACVLPAYSGPTENTSFCANCACALYRIRTYDLSRVKRTL